jgi:hypothetical protein
MELNSVFKWLMLNVTAHIVTSGITGVKISSVTQQTVIWSIYTNTAYNSAVCTEIQRAMSRDSGLDTHSNVKLKTTSY